MQGLQAPMRRLGEGVKDDDPRVESQPAHLGGVMQEIHFHPAWPVVTGGKVKDPRRRLAVFGIAHHTRHPITCKSASS
jgi:hypothetical protein